MKIYIAKDQYTKKQKILLMPKIYEQIENNINRTGIIYKHSSFNIRHGSYDELYDFEEITVDKAHKHLKTLKMLNTAINREKEKKHNNISHRIILCFYDEFIETYAYLYIKGCENKC